MRAGEFLDLLKAAKLSQRQVASLVGVHERTVRKWVEGRRVRVPVAVGKLLLISVLSGIQLDDERLD